MHKTGLLIALTAASILGGCSDDNNSDTAPPPMTFDIEASFQTCDKVVANPKFAEITSQFNCGTLQVPLDWNNKSGLKIDYFVRQLPATEPKRGQLWILPGGPGIAADDYPEALELAGRLPDLDIYMPDHRGTGRSTFLACTAEQVQDIFTENDVSDEDCLTYLTENWSTEELQHFNVTQAAEDIGQLINHFKDDRDEVYLYGSSYGTYWAQRYLHLYPQQASGIFIDAVCSLTSCNEQNGFFASYEVAGRELLNLCDQNAFCSSKIGGYAEGYLQNLYTLLENDHCPAMGLSREDLQFITGAAVSERELQAILPAFMYRMTRCNQQDVEAMTYLLESAEEGDDGDDESEGIVIPESTGLTLNIRYSELWHNSVTSQEIELQARTALFAGDGFGEEGQAQYDLQAQWPIYSLDSFATSWPETTTPMLITNGVLDPITTIESAAELGSQYVQPYQQTILIPYAGHGTLNDSPIVDSDEHCTAALATQFFQNPQQELDKSCLEQLQAPDFEGSRESAETYFNTMDLWENL